MLVNTKRAESTMGFWFFNPTLVRYRIERTPTKVCFFIVLTSIGELTKHEAEQWSDNQFYDRPALGGELLIPQRFKDCSNNLIRQSLAHLKLGRFFSTRQFNSRWIHCRGWWISDQNWLPESHPLSTHLDECQPDEGGRLDLEDALIKKEKSWNNP